MALRRCIVRDADVLRCQHRMRRSENNAGRWGDVSCPAVLLSCQQATGTSPRSGNNGEHPTRLVSETVPARQIFRL